MSHRPGPPPDPMSASATRGFRCADWGVALLLCLLVAAVYAPVRSFPFVVYDDGEFVVENPPVAAGLTSEGVVWAFTQIGRASCRERV